MTTKRKQNPTIQIPSERLFQLKELSDVFGGVTASATLGKLFALAREQGLVGHSIPNIQINAFPDGLAIGFDGKTPTPFSYPNAAALSVAIRDYIAGTQTAKRQIDFDSNFDVAGKGNGVSITIPATGGVTKVLTHDVASDFADLIDHQICSMQKT